MNSKTQIWGIILTDWGKFGLTRGRPWIKHHVTAPWKLTSYYYYYSSSNDISIGSSIFAGFTNVMNRHTHGQTDTYTQTDGPHYSVCSNNPHLMQCTRFGPMIITTQTFGEHNIDNHVWVGGVNSRQTAALVSVNWLLCKTSFRTTLDGINQISNMRKCYVLVICCDPPRQ